MSFNREDPTTWPVFRPRIIALDVGRSHDRSTAVVGGVGPFEPRLLGVTEFEELPQNQFGSAGPARWQVSIAASAAMRSLSPISAMMRAMPRICRRRLARG